MSAVARLAPIVLLVGTLHLDLAPQARGEIVEEIVAVAGKGTRQLAVVRPEVGTDEQKTGILQSCLEHEGVEFELFGSDT